MNHAMASLKRAAALLLALTLLLSCAYAEEDAQLSAYNAAQALFEAGDFEQALAAFEALGGYEDSRARASESRRQWRAAQYREAIALFDAEAFEEAKAIFESLERYENSRRYVYDCTMAILRRDYKRAGDLYREENYAEAKALYESLNGFHDSEDRAEEAAEQLALQQLAAAEREAYQEGLQLKEAGELIAARNAFIQAGDCPDATEQLYEVVGLLAKDKLYQQAQAELDAAGDLAYAYDAFTFLNDYSDSAEKAAQALEAWHESLRADAANADAAHAFILLTFVGDEPTETATPEALYAAAQEYADAAFFAAAQLGFTAAAGYEDSDARAAEAADLADKAARYQSAAFYAATRDQAKANELYASVGDFKNAASLIADVPPTFTATQFRDDKTTPVSDVFTAADGSTHRYQMYKGVHTWVEAKAFCEALGGHLATMTSKEENDFVYWFMRDNGFLTAYFGLSDEARVGNWVWVTGEPFEYTNWHRGEPSRSGRERYGMYFYKHTDGTWNDAHFYEDAENDPGCSYICEWDD